MSCVGRASQSLYPSPSNNQPTSGWWKEGYTPNFPCNKRLNALKKQRLNALKKQRLNALKKQRLNASKSATESLSISPKGAEAQRNLQTKY